MCEELNILLCVWLGYFEAKRPLKSVIIQARTGNGRHYGSFYYPDTLTVAECIHPDVSYANIIIEFSSILQL